MIYTGSCFETTQICHYLQDEEDRAEGLRWFKMWRLREDKVRPDYIVTHCTFSIHISRVLRAFLSEEANNVRKVIKSQQKGGRK